MGDVISDLSKNAYELYCLEEVAKSNICNLCVGKREVEGFVDRVSKSQFSG